MNHKDIFGREIDELFYLDEMMSNAGLKKTRRSKWEVNRSRGRDPKDYGINCVGDDKYVRLPSCHYTDERFKTPQTIFGRDVGGKKGYHYDYDDRFQMWNWDLWDEGIKRAREYIHLPECNWEDRSVKFYEMAIGYFHQRVTLEVGADMTTAALKVNVCIGHVLTGFNWSNGHSYYVFGYKLMGKDKDKFPR